jgi:hypothetical protein
MNVDDGLKSQIPVHLSSFNLQLYRYKTEPQRRWMQITNFVISLKFYPITILVRNQAVTATD